MKFRRHKNESFNAIPIFGSTLFSTQYLNNAFRDNATRGMSVFSGETQYMREENEILYLLLVM